MEEQLLFPDRAAFRRWLEEHHDEKRRVWLIFGKTAKLKTLRPDEALEEALCFGWIDELIKSIDADRYIKRFSPRVPGSRWSARNKAIVAKLIADGRMTAYGLKSIEDAKQNGVWDAPSQPRPSVDQVDILTKTLAGAEPALSNFLKMPVSVRKAYTMMYLDAKQEATRQRRLQKIIGRLNENKKPME